MPGISFHSKGNRSSSEKWRPGNHSEGLELQRKAVLEEIWVA